MSISVREGLISENRLPKGPEIPYERLRLLDPRDREIMSNIFVARQSVSSVARLLKIPRFVLARRVKKLVKMLRRPELRYYLLAMPHLRQTDKSLAKDYFCRGLSIRQIAERRNVSFYITQRQIARLALRMKAFAIAKSKFRSSDV